ASGKTEVKERVLAVAGTPTSYEVSKGVYRDRDGKILGVYSVARNITEQKKVGAALRESQERFQNFMDNSPCVAFMKDEDGRYVYINRGFERRFGLKLEDVFGGTDFDLWPIEVAHALRAADQVVLSSEATQELVETVPDPDGSLHYWQVFK